MHACERAHAYSSRSESISIRAARLIIDGRPPRRNGRSSLYRDYVTLEIAADKCFCRSRKDECSFFLKAPIAIPSQLRG